MKTYIKLIPILLFVLLLSCTEDTVEPVINLLLGLSPSTQTTSVGQSAVYTVSIEDAKNLFAISVEIVFDNSLISIPDVDPVIIGDFWDGNANLQGWFFEEPGILSVAIGLEGTGGITGDGALFTFELNADAIGTSDIVFQNLSLIDQNGNLIEGFNDIVFENGELIIQ